MTGEQEAIVPRRAGHGTALYVHVPYCVHKCPYCDFFSVVGAGEDLEGTVDALVTEAELRGPRGPRTVFFGGGTPSYLPPHLLERLFDGLERATGFRGASTETTVECNPESLDEDRARLLADLGATRLSIGVQSLDPATLRFFERPHGPEEALAAVAAARRAGYRRVSVDMIHGAPTEPLATWERNLLRILDLEPTHVSAYGLTVEPGTPLHARVERGEVQPLTEDQELRNLERTRELLTDAGLEPYEVSNFASSGDQCRHNVNYWRNGDYVGLGPSAASHVEGVRCGNARSVSRWRAAVLAPAATASGDDPVAPAWSERLDPRARLGETWWLGLRLAEGVDPATARARAGWPPRGAGDALDPTLALVDALVGDGLLARRGNRVALTPRGLPLADWVGRRFLDP